MGSTIRQKGKKLKNKIITVLNLCVVLFMVLCNTTIRTEALTQKDAQEMITKIKPLEGEIQNPDISLSDDELNTKYKGVLYREVELNYKVKGFSEYDLQVVVDKVDNLKQTSPIALSNEDKQLLYRLVYAESGNQSYETQTFVCSVVLNRLRSDSFPNTIREIIYQPSQFEVVANGDIDTKTPSEMTIQAVNDVLEHGVTNDKIISFRNNHYHVGLTNEFVSGILYFSSL